MNRKWMLSLLLASTLVGSTNVFAQVMSHVSDAIAQEAENAWKKDPNLTICTYKGNQSDAYPSNSHFEETDDGYWVEMTVFVDEDGSTDFPHETIKIPSKTVTWETKNRLLKATPNDFRLFDKRTGREILIPTYWGRSGRMSFDGESLENASTVVTE